MPQIPIYNSQKNITANPAAPMRNEASQPFEDQQKILGVTQEITQKWSDAHDVMQYTEAKSKYEVAAADIHARASADPDFKNSGKYYKELEEAKSLNLKGISNSQVANKLETEFQYGNSITQIKIDAGFKAKQLEYNKVMVKSNVDVVLQKKLSATTAAEAKQYDQQVNELLDMNVKSGVLTYAEAEKLLTDAQTTSTKYEIYADVSTQEKDSQILKELKDPGGKYSYLDPKTRLSLVEESQRRIFQNNQTFKRQNELSKDERFQNIFEKANEGTLTLQDMDAEQLAAESGDPGALSMKEILEIRKGIQTRIKNDLEVITDKDTGDERAIEYYKFINTFISDETDRQKGREAIVQAFKDGHLSSEESAFLNSLKRETESIQKIKDREQFMGNKFIPFKNAINSVNDFFTGKKNFTESEKAMTIKKILNGAINGGDPVEIKDKVLKETIIQKNPNITNLSPDGTVVMDSSGNMRIMDNTGKWWNVTEKPKNNEKKESK